MTNQKKTPCLPNAKSRIRVAFTLAISKSQHLGRIRGFVGNNMSKKKVWKRNENGGISRGRGSNGNKTPIPIACSLDLMRASSPTRLNSSSINSLPHQSAAQSPWIIQLPSALNMFHQITTASKGKQIVMFLDYDGTLSPIVEDPDKAFMTNQMREAVRNIATYFPTAIVSGRCTDKVYEFVGLAELFYAGSHGMDIQGPTTEGYNNKYKKGKGKGNEAVLFQPASELLPMIDEVHKTLSDITQSITGAKVENNKFCISVHFRCVDEKRWAVLAEQVKSVVNQYPKLILTLGRKVLEIRPAIKWDKGKALEFLLDSLGLANSSDVLPVYIGDDRTDEDAFKVLQNKGLGFGILVSKFPKETSASYSLQEPSEVEEFLCRLVEWKRSMGLGEGQ